MTDEEIKDALGKLMGWRPDSWGMLGWNPLANWNDAMMLRDVLAEKGFLQFELVFDGMGWMAGFNDGKRYRAGASDGCRAICLAALKAAGVEVS